MEMSTLSVAFLTLVGGYALVKGEVSEKLALRYGAGIAPPRCAGPECAGRGFPRASTIRAGTSRPRRRRFRETPGAGAVPDQRAGRDP